MKGAKYTPVEEKDDAPKPKVRARKSKGQFKADDPQTPENEAWEPPKE